MIQNANYDKTFKVQLNFVTKPKRSFTKIIKQLS